MTRLRKIPRRRTSQHGAAMLEALISLLIVAFGLLGLFGLQTQVTVSQMESYQRAQALVLVKDMAQRLEANRLNAAAYVANDVGLTPPAASCNTLATTADRDLCEWGTLLQGAAEQQAGSKVGAMIGARGCISRPDPLASPNLYVVAVVWQGLRDTGATPINCGQNAYSSEASRRGASVAVQIPVLS